MKLKGQKVQTLKDYTDSVKAFEATIALGKPDSSIRSRLRSGKNWVVIDVSDNPKVKKLRCALIDDV